MEDNGVPPYAVNRSYPEEEAHPSDVSRKIHADLFIDDRNFGGFPGWGEIYQQLNQQPNAPLPKKKGWFRRGR